MLICVVSNLLLCLVNFDLCLTNLLLCLENFDLCLTNSLFCLMNFDLCFADMGHCSFLMVPFSHHFEIEIACKTVTPKSRPSTLAPR